MIDLDQKLHRSLVALADARPVTTPPVASIVTTATTRAARPRRPRRVVIAAVAGGLTLGVSGAALAGVLPGPVMSAFDRVSGWGGPCRIDRQDTRLVASTRTPGGSTLEWWASSTATSHEIDDYWRTVASDGTTHGIAESCEPRGIRDTSFFCCSGQTSATETDFWGEAPDGTASLHVVLSDGSTVAVALQDGRYFIASFAAGAGARRRSSHATSPAPCSTSRPCASERAPGIPSSRSRALRRLRYAHASERSSARTRSPIASRIGRTWSIGRPAGSSIDQSS